MLQVRARFPWTWWIHSNTALGFVFSEVIGLAGIPYSISIRYFLNLWPINSDPWSYVIFIGLGYLQIHVISTKFAIDIACSELYCVNITDLSVNGFIFLFRITYISIIIKSIWYIRFTKSLFHGIFSATVDGNLPFFYLLYVGKYKKLLNSIRMAFWCRTSTNVKNSLFPFHPFLEEVDMYNLNFIHNFGILKQYTFYPHML